LKGDYFVKRQALIVMDVQNAIFLNKNFEAEMDKIKILINLFEQKENEIIFVKHINYIDKESPLYYKKAENIALHIDCKEYSIFTKSKPNAFSNNDFADYLKQKKIEQLVIVGFNTEYSCLFTTIVAEHEGYDPIFVEDACGTVCSEATYEMPGLDINDFVGSFLNWSECITVLYLDEYLDEYSD